MRGLRILNNPTELQGKQETERKTEEEGMEMEEGVRRIAVVVEDVEAARTALRWALHNLVRFGDLITLVHVFPTSRSRNRNKSRLLRLKGFQLTLSFKEICNTFPNTKVEMIVIEGDQDGVKIATVIREIGASTLVVGLHENSFLYKLALGHSSVANNFNCRVLAIKQPPSPLMNKRTSGAATPVLHNNLTNSSMDFSQIDIAGLDVPDVPPPKVPYRICPNPYAIIWKSRKARRR